MLDVVLAGQRPSSRSKSGTLMTIEEFLSNSTFQTQFNMKLDSIVNTLQVHAEGSNTLEVGINDDIRPLPPARRTWGQLAFFSFQAINQVCISNWQVGSSLIAVGLSVWQTMIAVIFGKVIIATVAVLNGYVGAQWHIGYPVYCRVIWGMYGSYLAISQRILLSVIWYAIQSWFGGLSVSAILSSIFSSFFRMENTMPISTHMTTQEFVGWVVYNLVSIPILYIPPEKTKKIFAVMNSIAFLTLFAMMIWALSSAHGAGPLLSQPANVSSGSELGWAVIKGITTVIGTIAVGLTNAPDWARFARRPGDQVTGQWTAIIGFGAIMPLFGCLTTSATIKLYGVAIWNPPSIVLQWLAIDYSASSRAAAIFAGVGLVISQLAINTVDNGFSLGMDLSGVFPKFVNIRRGAYLGLFLATAACPWYLLSSASSFVSVLSAYSVFLGPMLGIQICDYWLIRQRKLSLSHLYTRNRDGSYYYWNGFNLRAFAAWIIGFAPHLPGLLASINPTISVPQGLVNLYYLAFIDGFIVSFMLYWGLNVMYPPPGAGAMDSYDEYGTFTEDEALGLGIVYIIGESNSQDYEIGRAHV